MLDGDAGTGTQKRRMSPAQLIAALNSLSCGDLDSLTSKLDETREACREMGYDELAGLLDEARRSLLAADLRNFRRRVETVVSRLGHLRSKHRTGRPVGAS